MHSSTQSNPADERPWPELVAAVYRYQLVWCGDPTIARKLSEQTLALAGRYALPERSRAAWLLGLAHTVRVFPGKKRLPTEAPEEGQIDPERTELAMVAQLAVQLERLPGSAAEALVLFFFAGLDEAEIAAVLGGSATRSRKLLGAGLEGLRRPQEQAEPTAAPSAAELAADLAELAGTLAPDPAWLEKLCAQPAKHPHPRRLARWWPGRAGRTLFAWRRFVSTSGWLATAAALLVIVAMLFNLQAFRPPSPPTALPQPAATLTTDSTQGISTGWLVRPASDVCQAMQKTLTGALGQTAQLKLSVIYANPMSLASDPLGKGMGCQIEVSGAVDRTFDGEKTLEQVLQALSPQDLFVQQSFHCDGCVRNNAMFDEYPSGRGAVLAQKNGDQVGILTVAWKEPQEIHCDGPSQCALSTQPPGSPLAYSVRLTLASNAAQAALTSFLSSWSNGDPKALNMLNLSLRLNARTIAGLDRLAGFQRNPADVLQFSAVPVDNSGEWLRVAIQGSLLSKLTLPARTAPAFQLAIQRSQGRWRVTDLSMGTLFPPSTSAVLWATAQGQVMSYSLANRKSIPLTGPDVYNPSGADRSFFVDDPAQISPNGKWLSLVQPKTEKLPAATLLLDLYQTGQFVRLPYAARLAWSIDGERIAFFHLDQPRKLYVLAAPFDGEPQELAAFEQDMLALAWSTNGKQIAIETRPAEDLSFLSDQSQEQARELYLVYLERTRGRSASRLTRLENQHRPPAALEMSWTADDGQIWLPKYAEAVDAASGQIYPLFYPVENDVDATINNYLLIRNQVMDASQPGGTLRLSYWSLQWIAWDSGSGSRQLVVSPAEDLSKTIFPPIQLNYVNMAWTLDEENLIAGGDYNLPGAIYRVSAHSGEHAQLAENVFWIGVDDDIRLRIFFPLENEVQVLPAPDLEADWPCRSLGAAVPCIPLPADWKVNLSPMGSFLLATNLDFESPYGWSAVRDGAIFLQASIYPNLFDPTRGGETTIDKLAPPEEKGRTWEEIQIDGVAAVHHFVERGYRMDTDAIYIPLPKSGWLSIYMGPEGAYDSPAAQKILGAIRILKPE